MDSTRPNNYRRDTLPTLPSLQAIQEPELIAENENDNEMSLPTKGI